MFPINESNPIGIEVLIGKILTEARMTPDREEIYFTTDDGRRYKLFHQSDCCESVNVDDICGEMSDLVGSPITQAEESTSDTNPPGVTKECQDSFTWTFYRMATAKGQVVIRWYGESNGYYSERVDFVEI